jgi:phosphatidylserine decarboxylase
MAEPLYFYRRGQTAKEEETVLGGGLMRWAYESSTGAWLTRFLFAQAWPSRLLGCLANTRFSRRQIAAVIRDLGIDAGEFADGVDSYPTFNAFFSRRLKATARPFAAEAEAIASPADGRVLVFPRLQKETVLPVKGKSFTVDSLLGQPSPEFYDGSLAIVRLCPADYHRFHFPCDGAIIENRCIKGYYHSVNPFALATGVDVFGQNERHITMIESERLGRYGYIEVGAFGVGSIVQTFTGPAVRKGDEKGYFQYGGSTIVLVFQPEQIQFEKDLVEHSAEGVETFLKAGEVLGQCR